ncbi:protein transport protein sec61 alpha subunit [Ecytonucleospora hepatopenaei]|uniref:Protein transport protein sec61 alpha subunit n=1 Tax=Ecytonucleospora hepatopenaei TaxID=646526 RepID=A0A1W0E8E2_9MICR|nr:protein transport protein sec61 alpha subunit [Ecytonucleospora hepatopenaei]
MQTQNKKQRTFFQKTLLLARPFLPVIPEVTSPLRTLHMNDKLFWTFISILIYSIASQVPLFGMVNTQSKDPLEWLRVMMASNRGTLMDIGIGPVVSSSMIMNFLTTTGLIVADFTVLEDKILYDCFGKLIAILITIVQAIVQIQTGFYGPTEHIPTPYKAVIFVQLLFSGLIIILLDELLQKGYGYGNGVNLFIVANVCEKVVWSALSPRVFYTGRGLEFEGCLISLVYSIFSKRNKLVAIYEILFRENLPNLSQFIYTICIFAFVIWIQQLKVNLNVYSLRAKGVSETYPINLLYTSNTPVVLQGQLVSHFCLFSKLLYNRWPNVRFFKFLGIWDMDYKKGEIPIGGLSYYFTAPESLSDALKRPIHFIFYLAFTLSISAIMSKNWNDNQGETSEKVYEKFKRQGISIKGVRDANILDKLNEYIPVASVLSGLVTSAVIIFCDITSTIGSGTNMFLAASIIHQYVKLVFKEAAVLQGKVMVE